VFLRRTLAAIRRLLEQKYFPIAIAIFAFLVFLPTIKFGLMLDDLIHRSILIDPDRLPQEIYKTGLTPTESGKLTTALFDLFAFFGDKQQMNKARDYGTLPWWAPKNFRASMWRPLSSFTHWLDYRLFPDSPVLMHIHHLLWFSAVIFLIAVFYRRLLGPTWIAALAVIIFLIDENNVLPVMFNAHRNSIIAMFFGLLCTLCHHHWRKSHSLAAAIAAPLFLLLSLFCAEAGIATFAFILAYAIALEKGSIKKRAATIMPAVVTIVVWRLLYNVLGYGVDDMGISYIDPVYEPLRFVTALLERLPIMLFGLFSAIPPEYLLSLSPAAKPFFLITVVVLLLLMLVVMAPLIRNNKLALYFCLAAIFAIIPFCACYAQGRNLLFASIPGFALIAVFITDVFKKADYLPKSFLYRAAIWIIYISLFLTHIPGALLGKVIDIKMTTSMLSNISALESITKNIDKDTSLIMVNTHCVLNVTFLPFYQAYDGHDLPENMRTLVQGYRALEVKRANENTLIIKSKTGDIFSCGDIGPMHIAYVFKTFNDLFQSDKTIFKPGDIFELPRLTINILGVDQKDMPTEIAFVFDTALEDDSLRFFYFDWYSFSHKPFEVPAVGQAVELPGPPYASLPDVIQYFKWQLTKSLFE
jgi:hypothetical protein